MIIIGVIIFKIQFQEKRNIRLNNIEKIQYSNNYFNYLLLYLLIFLFPSMNRIFELFLPYIKEIPYIIKILHSITGIRVLGILNFLYFQTSTNITPPNNLKNILTETENVKGFAKYMETELKAEYLFLYVQCERYKQMKEYETRNKIQIDNEIEKTNFEMINNSKEMAWLIYERYLRANSVLEIKTYVNLMEMRERIKEEAKGLFEDLQKMIIKRVFKEEMIKFKRSEFYQKILSDIEEKQKNEKKTILKYFYETIKNNLIKRYYTKTILFSMKNTIKKILQNVKIVIIFFRNFYDRSDFKRDQKRDVSRKESFEEIEKIVEIENGNIIEYVESRLLNYIEILNSNYFISFKKKNQNNFILEKYSNFIFFDYFE
jgi:hypothetical protein